MIPLRCRVAVTQTTGIPDFFYTYTFSPRAVGHMTHCFSYNWNNFLDTEYKICLESLQSEIFYNIIFVPFQKFHSFFKTLCPHIVCSTASVNCKILCSKMLLLRNKKWFCSLLRRNKCYFTCIFKKIFIPAIYRTWTMSCKLSIMQAYWISISPEDIELFAFV